MLNRNITSSSSLSLMSRRGRVFLFLLFPGLVLLWGLAWLLYSIDFPMEIIKPKKSSIPNDLQMFVLTREEKNLDEDAFSESFEE